jgi:hypothetical protein
MVQIHGKPDSCLMKRESGISQHVFQMPKLPDFMIRIGSFNCKTLSTAANIYRHGPVINPRGTYYLTHADGTRFSGWQCTAWNGIEIKRYRNGISILTQRVENNILLFSLLQPQWRGCDKSMNDWLPFEGCGRIMINPEFSDLLTER